MNNYVLEVPSGDAGRLQSVEREMSSFLNVLMSAKSSILNTTTGPYELLRKDLNNSSSPTSRVIGLVKPINPKTTRINSCQ